MKQFLFVRRGNLVASWKWQRGGLRIAALNGNEWSDFCPSYWDEWKDANQVTDSVDVILLSDSPDGFGALPDWLSTLNVASSWTLEQIAMLADDEAFGEAAFSLTQGKNKNLIGEAEVAAPYTVQSTCKFVLPKEAVKSAVKPKEKSAPKVQPCADSYGDKKALALKVGKVVSAIITVVAPMRKCCYAKSKDLDDLIKIKTSVLPESLDLEPGAVLRFKVSSVDNKRTVYSLVIKEDML